MSMMAKLKERMAVEWRERRRWRKPPAGPPRLFYGRDSIGGRHEVVAGGIVKIQDLQNVFPNTPVRPNLLYLVSSAIPPYAPLMAGLASRGGGRIVLNQNGVAYAGWYGHGWQRANLSLRALLHGADYVFYQSRFCQMAADRFLGEYGGPSEVLYNPVDTAVFAPAERNDRGNPWTLLLAGTHCHHYRVHSALVTIRRLLEKGLNVRLVVAGRYSWRASETDATKEVDQMIAELDLASVVRRQGAYTQAEAVGLLRSADILLHTKYNDPCPRLVVEAMACGVPVVYSASGGVPELVGENAGVGVPAALDWDNDHPPAPDALAAGVIRVVGDYHAYALAARARAVAEFDVGRWVERHRVVFEAMVSHV